MNGDTSIILAVSSVAATAISLGGYISRKESKREASLDAISQRIDKVIGEIGRVRERQQEHHEISIRELGSLDRRLAVIESRSQRRREGDGSETSA